MEIKNTYSPSFSAIRVNESAMNRVQRSISRNVSNLLDYTDAYNSVLGQVDVYLLPGKKPNSIIVKFMDTISDMFFKKGKIDAQRTVAEKLSGNYTQKADEVCEILTDIKNGKIKTPKLDESKFLDGTTDLAKIDEEAYAELFEDIAGYNGLTKSEAESLAINNYQQFKHMDMANRVDF